MASTRVDLPIDKNLKLHTDFNDAAGNNTETVKDLPVWSIDQEYFDHESLEGGHTVLLKPKGKLGYSSVNVKFEGQTLSWIVQLTEGRGVEMIGSAEILESDRDENRAAALAGDIIGAVVSTPSDTVTASAGSDNTATSPAPAPTEAPVPAQPAAETITIHATATDIDTNKAGAAAPQGVEIPTAGGTHGGDVVTATVTLDQGLTSAAALAGETIGAVESATFKEFEPNKTIGSPITPDPAAVAAGDASAPSNESTVPSATSETIAHAADPDGPPESAAAYVASTPVEVVVAAAATTPVPVNVSEPGDGVIEATTGAGTVEMHEVDSVPAAEGSDTAASGDDRIDNEVHMDTPTTIVTSEGQDSVEASGDASDANKTRPSDDPDRVDSTVADDGSEKNSGDGQP